MIDLLIVPCGQLLTMAGGPAPRRGQEMAELGLIEHGAVGINAAQGTIEYAGPADGLDSQELAPSCPVVDATGCVVLPGLIDSHTHLVFAGDRADEFYRRSRGETYQQIAQSGGGIRATMAATRAATAEELFRLAHARLIRLYKNGTTTVETKSGYGLDRESELKQLQVAARLRESVPGTTRSESRPRTTTTTLVA